MEYATQRDYIGNISQVMPVKEYRLCGGRMDGVRAVDMTNGAGLDITLLPDRCMDIYSLRVNGKSLAFHSPAGVAHPAFAQPWGAHWLATFAGGFLATCGLDNIGSPCEADGEQYPLHGQIGSAPAEQFSLTIDENAAVPTVTVRGVMRQAQMFGLNLSLTRTITCRYGDAAFTMADTIQNHGHHPAPYLLLYHFNLGYPLLSETAEIFLPSATVRPRTQHAANHLDSWRQVLPPQNIFEEMCYYHTFGAGAKKEYGIRNPAEGLAVHFTVESDSLDHFMQWKMLEKGTYVMGLEPCNATIDGHCDAAQNGTLKTLAPGEVVHNVFTIDTSCP